MNTNCMFPIIEYPKNQNHQQWGHLHGEMYRDAIKELFLIRKELMLKKNPKLITKLDQLAQEQFSLSKHFAPHLALELQAISEGANLSLTDIVILNNYTDFRDIILPDEGCSTIHTHSSDQSTFAGQTWDMHRSAKNYMALLSIPATQNDGPSLILTLVGCLGLMGVNSHQLLIGVNNINTTKAKSGIIWPLLVRRLCEEKNYENMRALLMEAPVTSGHNYLISSPKKGEHLEITPTIQEQVSVINENEMGSIFHTNHCLAPKVQELEDKSAMSSTTHQRFSLLQKHTHSLKTFFDFKSLLQSHDGYPKSICSHFENGAQDPSFTCGGGAADLTKGHYTFWRGCPIHDHDYQEYSFALKNNSFSLQ